MDIMTEKELRAINPEEYEGKDIIWDNGAGKQPFKFTARVLFDYDQGLSILEKNDTKHCLTAIHGPGYKGRSSYVDEEYYHNRLTEIFEMLSKGYYKGSIALGTCYDSDYGRPTCSFT